MSPEPEDEVVVHTEEVADKDVQRYADAMNASGAPSPAPNAVPADPQPGPRDHTLTWPHEASIRYAVPHVARGKIATQLLNAAEELGYPVAAIRSQEDGFLVPSLVYYHLFPSQIPTPADITEDRDE